MTIQTFFVNHLGIKVNYVNHMGDDITIVESARQSTTSDFKGWEKDEKFLEYLYVNKHLGPFEMCELMLDVKVPLFVARQWFRHRTFSYNEFSERYSVIVPEFYVPEKYYKQAIKNKQSSDDVIVMHDSPEYRATVVAMFNEYSKLISSGVAREQARMLLPQCTFTTFRVKGNLRNWMHFLELRLASNAQFEIRFAARQVAAHIAKLFPRTYNLFEKHTWPANSTI